MITKLLFFLNYGMVFAYGIIISCLFAGIKAIKKNVCSMIVFFIIICDIQILFYFLFGFKAVEMHYPLITHAPLLLFLIYYFDIKFSTALSAILSAYLFTIPRRFIGTFFDSVVEKGENISYIAQILIALPIIYIINRNIAPAVKMLISTKGKTTYLFSGFLLIYYIFSYATTVYSNLLYAGNNLAVELLYTICVVGYFIFSVLYYQESVKRLTTETNYNLLIIKAEQAEKTLNMMKESQKLTAKYRHDLRHHIRFIKTCLANNKINEANTYLNNLDRSFNDVKIETFCDNTDANLVISYYLSIAKAANINVQVNTVIPRDIAISSIDLCVVLSNLLENAIKACAQTENVFDRKLYLLSSIKDNRFYLRVSNSYAGKVNIEEGLPQSEREGHGIGVNSVAGIVEKYNGVYNFSADDNVFTFKMLV